MVLWQSLRDVWLWADTSPEQRAELFQPPSTAAYERTIRARHEAPELTEALGTFHLLRWAAHVVGEAHVADACRQVSQWAEAGSLAELAAYFAEAGSVADPTDPERAHAAAHLTRRARMFRRSAAWYERTYKLAVRVDDRDTAVGALLGYGALLYGLGMYPPARRFLRKGARRAVRTGRRRKAAEAHHDLMLLSLDMQDFAAATQHASQAEHLYPLSHPRIPYLVHDFAVALVRQNYSSLASSMLEKVLSYIVRPEEAALVWGTLARAAAGAGQLDRFREAETKVLQLVGLYREHGAAALVNVGEGSRAVREWDKARDYGHLAVQIAQARMDGGQERLARELLKRVEKKEPAPGGMPAPVEIATLARRIAARLRTWRAPGPGPKPDGPGPETPVD
ncbi:MAG: hypothetical protein ABW277_23460 [Longimicrobiaceae bacterium]